MEYRRITVRGCYRGVKMITDTFTARSDKEAIYRMKQRYGYITLCHAITTGVDLADTVDEIKAKGRKLMKQIPPPVVTGRLDHKYLPIGHPDRKDGAV